MLLISHIPRVIFLGVMICSQAVPALSQSIPPEANIVKQSTVIKNDSVYSDIWGISSERSHIRLKVSDGILHSCSYVFAEIMISKSMDTGRTWTTVFLSDVKSNPFSVDWSPNGKYFVASFESGAIILSSDTCKTFRSIPSPSTNTIRAITVSNEGSITLGRILEYTLMTSTDEGETWVGEPLERYAPPYVLSFNLLDYATDGTLYFSFTTLNADTANRLLSRKQPNTWIDEGIPFRLFSFCEDRDGRQYVESLRRIGVDVSSYTEIFHRERASSSWTTDVSYIKPNGTTIVGSIAQSPYGNVMAACGKGLLLFSINRGPWTSDPHAKNIYYKVPGLGGISNLNWVGPNSIVATVGSSIVRMELDLPIVSVYADDAQKGDCNNASSEHILDVFTIDGRKVFEGPLTDANQYLVGARQCLLFVPRSRPSEAPCNASLKCP